MRAIEAEPDLLSSEQRTHARERQPEVSKRFSMTRMHDVDRFGSLGDDRQTEFAGRFSSDWWETGKLLAPQILFVRTHRLCQQRQIIIHREYLDDGSQPAAQQCDTI